MTLVNVAEETHDSSLFYVDASGILLGFFVFPHTADTYSDFMSVSCLSHLTMSVIHGYNHISVFTFGLKVSAEI